MRRILVWTETEITGLGEGWGLSRIITEVDEQGLVTRELGYDADGKLIHRCPGEPTVSDVYGVFDLAKIAPGDRTDLEPDEFDHLWG
jgi:hypothetical protein